jgi:hypothetical protein
MDVIGVYSTTVMPPSPEAVLINPLFAVEPLPTAYARYAAALDFLFNSLERLTVARKIQTHNPQGKPSLIRSRLQKTQEVCYGMALLAADEIGLPRSEVRPALRLDPVHAVGAAKHWLKAASLVPEFDHDVRLVVALSSDPPGTLSRMVHCWGVLGLRVLLVKADFIVPPHRLAGPRAAFAPSEYYLAAEKFKSFDVPYDEWPHLTQGRYRQILDESGSPDKALSRFQKGDY